MNYKIIFSSVFIVILIALLMFYWIFPINEIDFTSSPKNYSFTLEENESKGMQFYPNMRYATPNITYRICDPCTIEKKSEMIQAFDIIENNTIIDFSETDSNEQISITCQDENKKEGDFFIAGEGGPTNASRIEDKFVIYTGEILLIKDSECEHPNIALHELLHALGFEHSKNKNNLMYNISKCSQELSEDIFEEINRIYNIPSNPDLKIENASASLKTGMLNLTITIKNIGFTNAKNSTLIIYSDKDKIKTFPLESIQSGQAIVIRISNLLFFKKTNSIRLEIESDYSEIEKDNNKIELYIQE